LFGNFIFKKRPGGWRLRWFSLDREAAPLPRARAPILLSGVGVRRTAPASGGWFLATFVATHKQK